MRIPRDLEISLATLMATLDDENIPCEYSIEDFTKYYMKVVLYSGTHQITCLYDLYGCNEDFMLGISWWKDTLIKYKEKGWL